MFRKARAATCPHGAPQIALIRGAHKENRADCVLENSIIKRGPVEDGSPIGQAARPAEGTSNLERKRVGCSKNCPRIMVPWHRVSFVKQQSDIFLPAWILSFPSSSPPLRPKDRRGAASLGGHCWIEGRGSIVTARCITRVDTLISEDNLYPSPL